MTNQVVYKLQTENGIVQVSISPVIETIAENVYYSTGIYNLREGDVGLGEIVFDNDGRDWVYNGMDELSYEQAEELAQYIREQP